MILGSTARGRTYARKFDYDAARALRSCGWTYQAIADLFGVTDMAVVRVCNPERTAEIERKSREKYRAKLNCESCGKGMTHNKRNRDDGRLLCVTCSGRERRTRFSEIADVLHARCATCGDSLPLDQFPGGVGYRDVRPKGVHNTCRSCHAEIKRRYRETHREEQRIYDREYKRRRSASEVRS